MFLGFGWGLKKAKGRGEIIRFIYFQFTELKVFERVNTCTLSQNKKKIIRSTAVSPA